MLHNHTNARACGVDGLTDWLRPRDVNVIDYELFTPECSPPPFSDLEMYAPCPDKRVRLCGWLGRRGVE
jgi:hypothetical protein